MRKKSGNDIFLGIHPLEGFHPCETDEDGPFVWTKKHFTARKPPEADLFALKMCFYGDRGRLRVRSHNQHETRIDLYTGWHTYPIDLSGINGGNIEFELDRTVAVPGETRELGVMIREFTRLRDREKFVYISRVLENRILNHNEYLTSRDHLESFPHRLRITVEDRCNIKPPCVYCEWEWNKHLEEQNNFIFNPDTFEALGPFYDLAEEVVDCSYGEPLLNSELGLLIEEICGRGKKLEMTSNAQLLNAGNRSKILGKPMTFFVSLDSASREGYSNYRNDKFRVVTGNMERLCEEKKRYGGHPKVIGTYIVMRSNVQEVLPFIGLMQRLGVDGIKLRCLYRDPRMKEPNTQRNSFHFAYGEEILADPEFAEIVSTAGTEAEKNGLAFVSEMEFIDNNMVRDGPLCKEPWETFYIMKRGIHACCFSKDPLVSLAGRGGRPLAEFLRETWNGPAYRDLRTALAGGKLHDSCLKSPSCPIVRGRLRGAL